MRRRDAESALLRWAIVAVVAVPVLLIASACGGDDPSPSAEPPHPAARPESEVSEQDLSVKEVTKVVLSQRLAGSWYEADPGALRAQLAGWLDGAGESPSDAVCALILPHAGYRYSGETAARGLKKVQGQRFSRVIVMGPSHRTRMTNVASLPEATHYATPLGEVELDTAFMEKLEAKRVFRRVPQAHEHEHSVEIQVPLLQAALGQFKLVPIVVGQLDASAKDEMARVLLEEIDDQTLVVASSDFTHYGDRFGYLPFEEDVPTNLEKLDRGAYAPIARIDPDGFAAYVEETGITVCGHCPIGVLLRMLPADAESHLLRYTTSGNMTGDFETSVSYLSIAFEGSWPRAKARETKTRAAGAALTRDEQRVLLDLARRSIRYWLEHERMPTPEELGVDVPAGLERPAGAFVTLRIEGELRGCIGQITPRGPLHRTVMRTAVGSAFRDGRFLPVSEDELGALELKISVLTPPRPVEAWTDIEIGRHGVILEKGGRSATFLPQVAPEQGWNVSEMLTHLARKAGLPKNAWREGARLLVFEAEVFGDGDA